jgi:hypothetical protein
MKTKMEIFTSVDEQVEKYVVKNFDDFYTLGKAQLFGIDVYKTVEPIVQKIGDNKDVYEMLSPMNAILGADYDTFGVMTTGWAAPLPADGKDDGVAPSKHPERVRVRLFCFCDMEGRITSSLRFANKVGEVTYDENQARGSMRDAMLDFHHIAETCRLVRSGKLAVASGELAETPTQKETN